MLILEKRKSLKYFSFHHEKLEKRREQIKPNSSINEENNKNKNRGQENRQETSMKPTADF